MKKTKRERIKEKLTFKYRFVVLNEDTFEERFSFKLNRLNAFVFGAIFSIVLISLTIVLITVTPLKEYIQGYSSSELKKDFDKKRTAALDSAIFCLIPTFQSVPGGIAFL